MVSCFKKGDCGKYPIFPPYLIYPSRIFKCPRKASISPSLVLPTSPITINLSPLPNSTLNGILSTKSVLPTSNALSEGPLSNTFLYVVGSCCSLLFRNFFANSASLFVWCLIDYSESHRPTRLRMTTTPGERAYVCMFLAY